jgi:hypothetical protein
MSTAAKTNAPGVGAEGVQEISADQLTPVNDYHAPDCITQRHSLNETGGVA